VVEGYATLPPTDLQPYMCASRVPYKKDKGHTPGLLTYYITI